MDKQIIIDGVDVCGCEDYGYRGKAGYWCHNYDEPCSDYFDCRYKQLKRAEQKLEKIKEHLATVSYLAPATTRYLKHSIKQIIEE